MTSEQPPAGADARLVAALRRLRSEEASLAEALDRTPAPLGPVSVVLVTFNRCPFDPAGGRGRDNPLCWALDSLLAQRGGVVDEIVVVDDGSSDHTSVVLSRYQRVDTGIPVRLLRLPAHLGTAAARNAAMNAAKSRWLLYADDDCVMPPLWAAGAAATFTLVQASDPSAAALMLPFYYRDLGPNEAVPARTIGRLDIEHASFSTQFHCWPDSHLPGPPRIPGTGGLLRPLPVQLVGGVLMLDQAALRAVGGWADQSGWATSYADQMTLSADLTAGGFTLYFSPDPRLGSVHLKWGAAGRYAVPGKRGEQPVPGNCRTLAELSALAAVSRTNTGCRTGADVFFEEEIGSLFAFFASRSPAGGEAWAVRTYEEFVRQGIVHSRAIATRPDQSARRLAWRRGLSRGADAVGAVAWQVVARAVANLGEEPLTRQSAPPSQSCGARTTT